MHRRHRQHHRISIHALREEGDLLRAKDLIADQIFLSTPSARRATPVVGQVYGYGQFLSTPSARRATYVAVLLVQFHAISIHALREEGDLQGSAQSELLAQFLSTPSARRATAKTETKSLFSNKLYNILHEFRRALIYNGSKNYPNHAK